MKAVCDVNSGKWYLLAGLCIQLNDLDFDKDFDGGLSVDGWSGIASAVIYGDGCMVIDPESESDLMNTEDEGMFFEVAGVDWL